jgi:hypothetical protein
MRRRHLLRSLAALHVLPAVARTADRGDDLENPYADVDWQAWSCLDSMSHQHQGQTEASLETFRSMGYGHFAFSNYYPSAPTYPLLAGFTQKHPEILAAPNAEHHSFTDSGLHCNALGSLYASGYGRDTQAAGRAASPLLRRFDGLTVFREPRPWEGVYRLDVRLAAKGAAGEAVLTLTGARRGRGPRRPPQVRSGRARGHAVPPHAGHQPALARRLPRRARRRDRRRPTPRRAARG